MPFTVLFFLLAVVHAAEVMLYLAVKLFKEAK